MTQFFEAVSIALSAIWASKLRSFMTVLGNIVAVASIIAVVSLVQGINASVKDAIVSFLSVDTFAVTRAPFTTNEDDRDRMWRNPRVSDKDAVALRHAGGNRILAVMTEIRWSGDVRYRDRMLEFGPDPRRQPGVPRASRASTWSRGGARRRPRSIASSRSSSLARTWPTSSSRGSTRSTR